MDSYKALAASYDRLTSDVDYRAVVAFYFEIIRREKAAVRTAADLAKLIALLDTGQAQGNFPILCLFHCLCLLTPYP